MPRPVWNGNISFGLLNVPVQLHSGERSTELRFRMLDSRDRNPVSYRRVNAVTGKEVPWEKITKGFEYDKDSYVVLDEDEIREAAPEATETVDIEAFVERADIDPRYFQKPYYLLPGKKADKGYVLLREVLKKTGKVGIARVVIRTRQYLAALLPLDDALVLDLMRFPAELVAADELTLPSQAPSKYRISAKEMEMGQKLVESMAVDWNPDDYEDDFRLKLREIIDERIAIEAGKKPKPRPATRARDAARADNVIDFTTLLKKSLESKGTSSKVSGRAGSRRGNKAG